MEMVSISTILKNTQSDEQKKYISDWVASVGQDEANEVRKNSFERGKELDRQVELFCKTGTCSDGRVKLFFDKYSMVSREQKVSIKQYGVYGRYDAILGRLGKTFINDFKTSTKFKRKQDVSIDLKHQLGAYYGILKSKGMQMDYGMLTFFIEDFKEPLPMIFTQKELEWHWVEFLERVGDYRNKLSNNKV